jgi:hypothetical protein
VLESFREVYANDASAREQNMTPEEGVACHQTHRAGNGTTESLAQDTA